jgi:hypothetical protein
MRKIVTTILFFWLSATIAKADTTYVGGVISTNTTWTLAGSPYVAVSNVKIGGSSVVALTIEPGVEVRFQPSTGLYVGYTLGIYSYSGHLEANGTAENRIVFTSNASNPQPGDWVGIKYSAYSLTDSLKYCDVKYAGAIDSVMGYAQSGVYLCSGSATHYKKLYHCVIDSTLGRGVYAYNPEDSLLIADCVITHSSEYGIYDSGRDQLSRIEGCEVTHNGGGGIRLARNYTTGVIYSGNNISYNGGYPLELYNQRYIVDLDGNTYIGNTNQSIRLTGHYSDNWGVLTSTIHNDGLPYEVASHLRIGVWSYLGGTQTLTIEPGVELRFNLGTGLYVGYISTQPSYARAGHLEANGTAENRIVFTSNASNPQPGDWVGIKYSAYSYTDSLKYCDIKYGGALDDFMGYPQCGVYLRSSTPNIHYKKLDHCLIDSSLETGIYVNASNDSISMLNCTILDNSGVGIAILSAGRLTVGGDLTRSCDIYGNTSMNLVNSAGITTEARYNYWGTIDSVTIASKISGNVNLVPWAEYSFRDNLGTLGGRVVDAQNSNPISDALVAIVEPFAKQVFTDGLGNFEMRDIPSNEPFVLFVSATNYLDKTIPGVTVPKGETNYFGDILLDYDLTGVYELVNLNPSPNPGESEIMEGGTLHRYYRVVDMNTGQGKARVPVELNDGSVYKSQDATGFLDVSIPSENIGDGSPGSTEEYRIVKVNGIDIPFNEQETFMCGVKPLKHSRTWKIDWSVQGGALGVRGSLGQSGIVSLVEASSSLPGPEYLKTARVKRGSIGVTFPVLDILPSVHIEGAQVNGGAGVDLTAGVDFIVGWGDEVKSMYATPTQDEMIIQSFMLVDALAVSFGSNITTIVTGLYDYYLQENLTQTLLSLYEYDEGFTGARAGSQITADLGVNSSTNYGYGIDFGLGTSAEGLGKCRYDHKTDEIYTSICFSAKARFNSAGHGHHISLSGDNPYLIALKEDFLPYIFNDKTVDFEAGLIQDGLSGGYKKFFIRRNARDVGSSGGQERTFTEYQEGLRAFELIPTVGAMGQFISQTYSNGFVLGLYNSSMWDYCSNLFSQGGPLQANDPDNFKRTYGEEISDISDVFDFSFKIKGLTLSFGSGIKYERQDSYTSKTGATLTGNFGGGEQTRTFDLQTYSKPADISDGLLDVLRTVLSRLDDALWNSFITSRFLSFGGLKDGEQTLYGDSIFYISDNGSYIQYDPGDFPPDLDTLTVYSWGWYGSSPAAKKTEVSQLSLAYRENLKEERQELADLDYGVGGFYQFESLELGLINPIKLVIKYDENEIVGFSEEKLKVYFEQPHTHRWILVGGTVDTVANTVEVMIDSLHTFTLAPSMPSFNIALSAFPVAILADSMTFTTVTSETILNNDSSIVSDGTLFTATTDLGIITTTDLDSVTEGTQIASNGGIITFQLRSGLIPGTATVSVSSLDGDAQGSLQIVFVDNGSPSSPTALNVLAGYEKVDVNWAESPESDIGGYKIYFDTDDSLPPYQGRTSVYGLQSPVIVGTVNNYTLNGLYNDTLYYLTMTAFDILGNESVYAPVVTFVPRLNRGDANGDGMIDVSDVVYLLNYLFVQGPPPVPLAAGDVTCDSVVDASDIVYLLNYLFVGGPAPCK